MSRIIPLNWSRHDIAEIAWNLAHDLYRNRHTGGQRTGKQWHEVGVLEGDIMTPLMDSFRAEHIG